MPPSYPKNVLIGLMTLALLPLVSCSSKSNSQVVSSDVSTEQLFSPAPPKVEQQTALQLTVPTRMTIDGNSVTIAGTSEHGARVRVDGKTTILTASGTFSIELSPITAGQHSFKVTAAATGKKETSLSVTVERPFSELQFDIAGEYLGQGEVKASITTNLWKNTELDINIFSVSSLNPGYAYDNGIDHSRWYRPFADSAKNLPIVKVQDNWGFSNILEISKDGSANIDVFLFHPEALKHNFSEIGMMPQYSQSDSLLDMSLRQRRIFEQDAKIIMDFRISQYRFNEKISERENNLNGMDLKSIKLPKFCKFLTYDFFGEPVTNIQCTKEILASRAFIAADKSKGAEEQRVEAAAREKAECSILTNTLCYFYVHKQGNVKWQEAKDGCAERGGELPSKTNAAAVREGLNTLYSSYPALSFVWTKETQGGYGWVEGFRKKFEGEYLSSWATANSDKRDYVTYVCVKKR